VPDVVDIAGASYEPSMAVLGVEDQVVAAADSGETIGGKARAPQEVRISGADAVRRERVDILAVC